MSKGRLEAFSDAVIAILITIIVLELRVPDGAHWQAVRPVVPSLLTYVLSFVTGWMGENHFAPLPTAVYGGVLLMCGLAYLVLQTASGGVEFPIPLTAGAIALTLIGHGDYALDAALGLSYPGWLTPAVLVLGVTGDLALLAIRGLRRSSGGRAAPTAPGTA